MLRITGLRASLHVWQAVRSSTDGVLHLDSVQWPRVESSRLQDRLWIRWDQQRFQDSETGGLYTMHLITSFQL